MSEEGEGINEYEENEVLWAKIRGFPWWPAYVSEIHPDEDPEKVQYTVIFFGDNTHSKLGPFKLRKFLQSYSSCYTKSKTNRKLKISIIKAEERLKENQQNVEIYEHLRNSGKNKRKTGNRTESRGSLSDDQAEDPPPFSNIDVQAEKSHTVEPRQPRLSRFKQQSSRNRQSKSIKSEPNNLNDEQRMSKQQQKHSSDQRKRSLRGTAKKEKEKEKQSSEHNSQEQVKVQTRLRPRRESQKQAKGRSKDSSSSLPEEQSEKSLDDKRKRKRPQRLLNKQQKQQPVVLPKRIQKRKVSKKQEPEEILDGSDPYESDDECSQRQKPLPRRRTLPQKITNARKNDGNMQPSQPNAPNKTLQKIKSSLGNKKELVKSLTSISVTINNVKQILDLGVTNTLLQGEMTRDAYIILQSLKATLLHKYFPDDLKMRKKHERMLKKKKLILKNKIQEEDDDDQDVNEEEEKDQDDQFEQMRKKTVVKLEQIVKKGGMYDDPKNIAIKLENFFNEKSELTGQKYSNIAFKHMKKLKELIQEKEKSNMVEYITEITECEKSGR